MWPDLLFPSVECEERCNQDIRISLTGIMIMQLQRGVSKMKVRILTSILFVYFMLGVSTGFSASFNNSSLYQEAAWLNLDLPQSQREKIDEIIVRNNDQITKLTKDAVNFTAFVKMNDNEDDLTLLVFLNTMEKVKTIQKNTENEIIKCLTPAQQAELNAVLEKRSSLVTSFASMPEFLGLDDNQNIKILNRLLLCKNQISAIAANRKLSWEQRREKMQIVNTFKSITQYLTPTQQELFNDYCLKMRDCD